MGSLLAVDHLSVTYGGVGAVRDISFRVDEQEIVALLGANGAGKTSTLLAVAGVVPPHGGRVVFRGTDITRLSPERRVRSGLSLTPEGRRIFASLTVKDNLLLGAATLKASMGELLPRILEWFPILAERYEEQAGQLSGGEQQQLAIARSLMSRPSLLLLDEPSLGLAPRFVELIFDIVQLLRDEGVTVLLVEQNVDQTLAFADRAYVLASGKIELAGVASELRKSSEIERAYLGVGVIN